MQDLEERPSLKQTSSVKKLKTKRPDKVMPLYENLDTLPAIGTKPNKYNTSEKTNKKKQQMQTTNSVGSIHFLQNTSAETGGNIDLPSPYKPFSPDHQSQLSQRKLESFMTQMNQESRNEVKGTGIQRNYSAIGTDILFPHDLETKSQNLAAVSTELVKKKKTVRTGRAQKNSLAVGDSESLFKDVASIATTKSRQQLQEPSKKFGYMKSVQLNASPNISNHKQQVKHGSVADDQSLGGVSPANKIMRNNSMSRNSIGSATRFIQRTKSNFGDVPASRFESIREKQEKDFERWKKKLVLQQEQAQSRLQKSASIEKLLEEKATKVMDLQKQRQLEVKQKNEHALARAKANESKITRERHYSNLTKHQVEQEKVRRQSEERDRFSQERMQLAVHRTEKIKSTLDHAEIIRNQKRMATLQKIEQKRKQEENLNQKAEAHRQKQNLIKMQRQQVHNSKINKAKTDLDQRLSLLTHFGEKKEQSVKVQLDKNKSQFELSLNQKRMKENEARQRVELSIKAMEDKQNRIAIQNFYKRQRIEQVKQQEAHYVLQMQERQKRILIEKAKLSKQF